MSWLATSDALRRSAESAVLTLAIPAVGYAVDRSDPFFLHYRFPWIVFAPLLVALRHGFALGVGSAAALGVALVLAWRTRIVPVDGFPGEPFVGLVALAMIAGQFADLWKREVGRLEGGLGVLRTEADRLARAHRLLELSHDRLDERVHLEKSSLRDAMDAVRELVFAKSLGSFRDHGATVIDVFSTHCDLEIGELFTVDQGVIGERCASIGRPRAMDGADPLLAQAVRSGRLTYVPAATPPDRDPDLVHTPLLAAIPFVDTSGVTRAVLCVHAMPFVAFDKRNLDAMVTLAGTFADLVGGAACAPPSRGSVAAGARA